MLTDDGTALTRVAINNGGSITTTRTITLNLSAMGGPTEYVASESPIFTGADWLPYSSAPAFTLSPGDGTKTVYVKVRDEEGESAGRSDSILLAEGTPTLTRVAINNRASRTNTRSVTLTLTASGIPTEYLASESPIFTGADWLPYSSAPAFTVSPGNGKKIVYVKLRDQAGVESGVRRDTIRLTV